MKFRDLLFTGMDIPNEARDLMDKLTSIDGMTEDERRAYDFGVSEAFRAVRTILNLNDDNLVVHLEGHDCIEEFDIDDLIELVEEKEGYCA